MGLKPALRQLLEQGRHMLGRQSANALLVQVKPKKLRRHRPIDRAQN
jgi:hypothetical protein